MANQRFETDFYANLSLHCRSEGDPFEASASNLTHSTTVDIKAHRADDTTGLSVASDLHIFIAQHQRRAAAAALMAAATQLEQLALADEEG